MHDPVPSCFRGGAAGAPPASTAAGPSLATSVYETHLGLAALSWSRTVLGLTLRLDLRLDSDNEAEPLRFRVRPWLLWKRRGSKRFHLNDHPRHRILELAWDLSRARFPTCGGPEPASAFFVAIVVDGEMLLAAGDLADDAHRRTKARKPASDLAAPALISRREHVVFKDSGAGAGGARAYTTAARVGGREREVTIELGARGRDREPGLLVALDGARVLHVRRIRWKFRGSERVETEGGERMQVSWDLHSWLFPSKEEPPPTAAAAPADIGRAVFVVRFESAAPEGNIGKKRESCSGEIKGLYKGIEGYFGKNTRNWSESSSGGGGGERKRSTRKKSLLKTSSSSSSTSSVSSASSSTVMEWASPEEVQLSSGEGFSLLVYAWKS